MQLDKYLGQLSDAIESRKLRIAVVGLGYVGLPTAIAFHGAGFHVVGIDTSEDVISSLKAGESSVSREIDLDLPVGERWELVSEFTSSIPYCDLAIVCVPTPVDENLQPDIGAVSSAIHSIIESSGEGKLAIILESTVQPGTTRQCISESISKSGKSKENFLFAYCPERVSPGEGGYGVSEVSRVIGSEDPSLTHVLSDLYSRITSAGIHSVSSIEVAEASKLVENAQRDIDIAFVNELSILLPKLGLDVEEVLSAAATKWNFHRHTPGIGVGGHCIPIDPHYYIEIAKRNGVSSAMSPAARSLNSSMPRQAALEVIRLCDGVPPKRALILGYSYKPNVSDCRETPVLPFANVLLELGVKETLVWDPLIDKVTFPTSVSPVSDPYVTEGVECLVVATAHEEVLRLDWELMHQSMAIPRIFDGRRCLDPLEFMNNGWIFHAVGRPWGEN